MVVLMGRSTWSAAQFLLNFLENYTQATFIGEPSGSRGNVYGDSRKTTLPNSGITVRTSVYYWQDWMPWDTRRWTAPAISAPLTSAAYRANQDPALEAALAYVPAKPLLDVLKAEIAGGGAVAAVAAYKRWSDEPAHKYADTEDALLTAGSSLLKAHPAEALKLFRLDAEANPHSYRAWYAIGAAQLAAGDKTTALENLERARALNPKDYEVTSLLDQSR
jgi:tetratricopeptide (TPR) repeat protein